MEVSIIPPRAREARNIPQLEATRQVPSTTLFRLALKVSHFLLAVPLETITTVKILATEEKVLQQRTPTAPITVTVWGLRARPLVQVLQDTVPMSMVSTTAGIPDTVATKVPMVCHGAACWIRSLPRTAPICL